jgi:hypothetical protein
MDLVKNAAVSAWLLDSTMQGSAASVSAGLAQISLGSQTVRKTPFLEPFCTGNRPSHQG